MVLVVVKREGVGFARGFKIFSAIETVEMSDETVGLRVRVGKYAVQWCNRRFVLPNWVVCGQGREEFARFGGNGD